MIGNEIFCGIICIFLGGLVLILGKRKDLDKKKKINDENYIEVEAISVDHIHNGRVYYKIYEYVVNNKIYRATNDFGVGNKQQLGDHKLIKYNKYDPYDYVFIDTQSDIIILLGGFAFIIIGLLLLFFS